MKRIALAAGWIAGAGFCVLTSLYCLLAYIPFTYQQVVKGELLPWLSAFARWHPLLRGIQNDDWAFAWSLIALVPLIAWGAFEIRRHGRVAQPAERPAGEDARLFHACWQTALFLTVVYAAAAWIRGGAPAAEALAGSLFSHLMVFLGIFAVLVFAGAVSRDTLVEFAALELLAAAAFYLLVRQVVMPQLSVAPAQAVLYSAAFALSAVSSAAAWSLRLAGSSKRAAMELLLAPLGGVRILRLGAPVLIAAVGIWLAFKSAAMDWNFLMQKLSACLVWILAFAAFYALAPRRPASGRATFVMLGVSILALAGYHAIGRTPREAYAAYDPSFRLIRDGIGARKTADTFYRFLAASTNIARSHKLKAVEVLPVASLAPAPSAAPRPNIFVFVIDSLRQDYVSAYNPKVAFTPAIDAFARESVVFPRAFTRYGATGLSEPSIWTGAMLVHQQYVTPFQPMNALEKLLDAEGYRRWVSMDNILRVILSPSPKLDELDRDKSTMNLDFIRTMSELRERLARDSAGPLFVYSQSQNIHVSVIQREKASVPAGESYPGFYAPYASRLKRMDAAFGEFVSFLKARGMYEDSLIVLTSDHGDSLGEEGRWGHAYTVYPEIVRIPLIVHLPRNLRHLAHDPERPAFLTDLTPSLYYLLGRKPVRVNPLFGRPLFTESLDEQRPYRRDAYVVASSYAAVYGLLEQNGARLYVADAVNSQAAMFDTASGRSLGNRRMEEREQRIRREVEEINKFYGFDSGVQ